MKCNLVTHGRKLGIRFYPWLWSNKRDRVSLLEVSLIIRIVLICWIIAETFISFLGIPKKESYIFRIIKCLYRCWCKRYSYPCPTTSFIGCRYLFLLVPDKFFHLARTEQMRETVHGPGGSDLDSKKKSQGFLIRGWGWTLMDIHSLGGGNN